MNPHFDHRRNHFDECIKGWLEDQPEQRQFDLGVALPSFTRHIMGDTQAQPWVAGPLDRDNELQRRLRARNGLKGSLVSSMTLPFQHSQNQHHRRRLPLEPQAPPRASEVDGFSWPTQALR